MKLKILSLGVIAAVSFSTHAIAQEAVEVKPKATESTAILNDTDKLSYTLGVDIGKNFKNQGVPLNPTLIAQGTADMLAGGKMLMTPKEMQTTLANFQKELMTKHQAQLQQIGEKNKAEGEAFLAANKAKPGVVTLPDGLQYKIIKPGSGISPTDKDRVKVNYEGTLPNGQVFDSSYTRGVPITFKVSEVIAGWTEVLKMMKPGAQWMIYVPETLAYGERGAGPIGPNQVLVFKVELLSVEPEVVVKR